MLLQINFKSGLPVYLQVVDQIKAAAASGAHHIKLLIAAAVRVEHDLAAVWAVARRDIDREEDNAEARVWRNRSLHHIDE